MKVRYSDKTRVLKIDPSQSSENFTETSLSPRSKFKVSNPKFTKFVEETQKIKQKKKVEERKKSRLKLALELHQQMYTEIELAAIFIQKNVRGYLARKQFAEKLVEKYEYENYLLRVEHEIGEFWKVDESLKHMSAYRIQRYWKGFRKHPIQLDLLKRLIKRNLSKAYFQQLQAKKLAKHKSTVKFFCFHENNQKKFIKSFWERWINNTENIETQEHEIESSSDHQEEIVEVPLITSTRELNAIAPTPIIKPKIFILSEANFIKPTLAYKYKRGESPNPQPPPLKLTKAQSIKNKRLVKQATARLASLNNKSAEVKKKDETQTVKIVTEVKFQKPALLKKYEYVKSKVKEFKNNCVNRSSSLAPQRKYSIESSEKVKENQAFPTIGLKQALPELYQFIEHYGPLSKKNESIQSTSGLVVFHLKNKAF